MQVEALHREYIFSDCDCFYHQIVVLLLSAGGFRVIMKDSSQSGGLYNVLNQTPSDTA